MLVKDVVLTKATFVSDYAFNNCDSLTSVTIGSYVEWIGDYAFAGCRYIKNVVIQDSPSGYGYLTIGNFVFYGCMLLEDVTILFCNIDRIGDYVFHDCGSLKSIKYGGTSTQWAAIRKGSMWDGDNYYSGEYTITYNFKLK